MPSFVFFSDTNESSVDSKWRHMPDPIVPIGFSEQKGDLSGDGWAFAWHCGVHTPLDFFKSEDGHQVILIGDAIAEYTDSYLSARSLFELVAVENREQGAEVLSRYSGLFAWVVIYADGCVQAGSDPFGLFPVYYFHQNGAFGLATSPLAFRAHPAYDTSLDPVGLSRMLIENGSSGSRILEKGGRRLNIAASLLWDAKRKNLRVFQHRYPGEGAVKKDMSSEEAIELSLELSKAAARRHIKEPVDSVLLSGGLDSRHLLSFANDLGHRPRCLTIGDQNTADGLCAREVARILKFPWQCSEGYHERPEHALRNELNLFSLSGGFNGMVLWSQDCFWDRGARCLSGVYLDIVYAPFWKHHANHAPGSFEATRDWWANRFGVGYDVLGSLYKDPVLKDSVDAAMHELYCDWKAMEGEPCEISWQSLSRYRGRAHLGGILWKNAFQSWPITPALDVPLVEGIRTMPGAFFKERWLQKTTFLKLHPDLASIPFASFGAGPRPIVKSLRSRYLKRLWKFKKRLSKRFCGDVSSSKQIEETRKAAWTHAHQLAMHSTGEWGGFFNQEAVEAYLKAAPVESLSSVNGEFSAGRRTLLGALCWLSLQD